MMDDMKKCANCQYHEFEDITKGWICVNQSSSHCADWTEDSQSCPYWEQRKPPKTCGDCRYNDVENDFRCQLMAQFRDDCYIDLAVLDNVRDSECPILWKRDNYNDAIFNGVCPCCGSKLVLKDSFVCTSCGQAFKNPFRRVIAIDFDGCLCENDWPDVGDPHWSVIHDALEAKASGAKLILWTCRDGEDLKVAIEACKSWGLEFDAVNDNLPELKKLWENNPRKIAAKEYWDDRAVLKNGKQE